MSRWGAGQRPRTRSKTASCFWLSAFLLVGIGANALLGWWWADPAAAVGMTFFIGREALEAWRGEADE